MHYEGFYLKEKFSIPGVGGIIVKNIDGNEFVLIQERFKCDVAEIENGLIEIPAGKIREYENIYDCLRREVFEETGYTVSEIVGEKDAKIVEISNYRVLNYEPFSSAQNLDGHYPIMVQVFICMVHENSKHTSFSNESKNIRWIRKEDLKSMLKERNIFYPMHISTLEKFCKL